MKSDFKKLEGLLDQIEKMLKENGCHYLLAMMMPPENGKAGECAAGSAVWGNDSTKPKMVKIILTHPTIMEATTAMVILDSLGEMEFTDASSPPKGYA